MEHIIFSSYLNFLKDERKDKWKRMKKIPMYICILFLLPIIFSALYLVNLNISFVDEKIAYVFVLIAMILTIVLYYKIEYFLIKHVEVQYKDYEEYCKRLYEWLLENWISDADEIRTIITRMRKYITVQKREREKYTDRFLGLLQTLIIPIILLTITSYVDNETNYAMALAYIISFTIIIIILFVFFSVIWNCYVFVKVKRLAQIDEFIIELQSVLDICVDKVYLGKKEKDEV